MIRSLSILATLMIVVATSCQRTSQMSELEDSSDIRLDTTIKDLGDIRYGDVAVASFKLKNTRGKEVVVKAIGTDCGCLKINNEEKRYASGESGTIDVEFDTRGQVGKQYHEAKLMTDYGQEIKLYVIADIKE